MVFELVWGSGGGKNVWILYGFVDVLSVGCERVF